MDGAFLIDKPEGISSFGVIELFQKYWWETNGTRPKRKHMPKFGHGGTLDPFATGLLIVLTGRAVKLARYFLGSTKTYTGLIRFGETTIPGDPTSPVSEKSDTLPQSIDEIQNQAAFFCSKPYLQTPPMHSAKKVNGRPLYELARQGVEIERKQKSLTLHSFEILSYSAPHAKFHLRCSSGTYVRTLTQDLAKSLGTVGMLDSLRRVESGPFKIDNAWTPDLILKTLADLKVWAVQSTSSPDLPDLTAALPCFVPFDRLLDGFKFSSATQEEAESLRNGRQNVLFNLLKKQNPPRIPCIEKEDCLAIYHQESLIAVARREEQGWSIERVF
ncbi:MAG: tRNA pseudouridine(55) synthase TruB [Bdellovibrio sp.]|nr:tRNA pseudouridine(55) synthase TruB [Bdellovibrio sp.]